MDEAQVREAAETHGDATARGDLRVAGSYLTKEAIPAAQEVMKSMPEGLNRAEVTSVEGSGDSYVVMIKYGGDGGEVTIESHWAERDGAPKIVGLNVP